MVAAGSIRDEAVLSESTEMKIRCTVGSAWRMFFSMRSIANSRFLEHATNFDPGAPSCLKNMSNRKRKRLIEAAEIIRELWGGKQIDHAGKYYKVNARLYDPPSQPIPLLMAGNGPKAMYRCGKYADGLVTDPKIWKEHKAEFQRGARDAAKDLARMPVFIEQYVVVGGDKEKVEAAEMGRFGPKAWKPYFNIRDPKTIEERADAEIPLEKVTDGWPVGTDPDVHVSVLSELFDSGATSVHIHSCQHDQKRVIDFYGKEVLPRLRKTTARAA